MNDHFQGRVALVAGANTSIGVAVCRQLAAAGATVIAADADLDDVQALSLNVGSGITPLQIDVSDPDAVAHGIEQIIAAHGALHMVVNTAGIAGRELETAEYPLEEWHRVMAVNLHGVFHVMKYAIRQMLAQGGGSIVNIAPMLHRNGWAGSAAYVAAKHALVGMTKSAAVEYASRGLRINAIGPNFVDTPLPPALQPDEYATAVGVRWAGVMETPGQIAGLAILLLADHQDGVNGSYQLFDSRPAQPCS